jgi:hypothetical protein
MLTDIALAAIADHAGRRPSSAVNRISAGFVEIIVKACTSDQPNPTLDKPDAVRGYYAEPINQGKSYENERSPTKAEREAAFTAMHCIDVPVPPEVIMGESLTREACMSHTGYLIAMQYLQENPAYKTSYPDVGEWSCVEHSSPVQGVAGM